MANLVKEARPGMTESDLADLVERGYVPHGGAHVIHFIGSTAMASPDCYVPRQFPAQRRLAPGDVVFCELSSAFWGYSGQVLRTFTVEAEPTQLYRDLHATAEAVYDSLTKAIRPGATSDDLIEATAEVEKNGFTTCDDVVHGYGGGYFQPIIGSKSRPAAIAPKIVLQENMCMVVQPNVITRDKTAGVQTGEMVRVTRNGCESLHNTPRGLLRSGQVV
jgi:Xaa-Pro aminopeptidase